MKAIVVQPPFVQLNAPYPAAHYLEAFLRERGIEAIAVDHSIELYRRIFSREGLARIFADARSKNRPNDAAAGRELARYFSYRDLYLEWIDGLADFLAGGDPGFAHRLATAVELPRGMRASAFLDERGGRIGPDDARALATRILDDLGDFIRHSLDPDFGTVRYGERIASSRADFAEIRAAHGDSYLMGKFYAPMLRDYWLSAADRTGATLVLVSVPFPGCLLGALACAESARAALGERAIVLFGGGYVSTELRALRDPGIFDYCDYLCFDSGFGSLASILEALDGTGREGLYRTMRRDPAGRIVVAGFPEGDQASCAAEDGSARFVETCAGAERFRGVEAAAVSGVFPDYRSADYGRYLRIVDSVNPMHRLWSDTPWLKYHLAHGCYWRRCSFCDTGLDYVAEFALGDIDALVGAAESAAVRTGLLGIHFVDEAMPMSSLIAFARANRARSAAGKRPFHFWGNVRFDSSWTLDRCEFLAASGLVAVSGGIEVATEKGLEMTDKGFDLPGLVRCLVAMKRAGLLVHAYLIYGFPGQASQDIVDSAEVCRQLFAAGLVDSAFWHRFVLTRHSRMYGEWKSGKRPLLRPVDKPWRFACNDMSFEGEKEFDRFEEPLATSLEAWMAGRDLEKPVSAWFGRPTQRSSIKKGYIEGLIDEGEAVLEASAPDARGRCFWIAGLPSIERGNASRKATDGEVRLVWVYRGDLEELECSEAEAARIVSSVSSLFFEGMPLSAFVEAAGFDDDDRSFAALRRSGLVSI